jgi:cold shock CspA family protein
MQGHIIRLFPDKGFGFGRGENGLTYFVHAKEVKPRMDFDLLKEGDRIEFEPAETGTDENNKRRALKIRRLAC